MHFADERIVAHKVEDGENFWGGADGSDSDAYYPNCLRGPLSSTLYVFVDAVRCDGIGLGNRKST